MRYLKKIFENDSNKVDKDELQDFCETYLVYLLDDTKFKLTINESTKWDSYIIWIVSPYFSWSEIENYYIPFVTMLSREYDLEDERLDQISSSIIINFMSGDQLFIKVDDIEDWKPNLYHGNNRIEEIGVIVKNTVKK